LQTPQGNNEFDKDIREREKEKDKLKEKVRKRNQMVQGIVVKTQRWWTRNLIDPTNPKIVRFNLVVAMSFYTDFILTGLLIGNYDIFVNGKVKNDFIYNS
jgi:hypothetical protein